jgi:hypothetical protein
VDLLAGIVVIELARYRAALPLEQRGDRIAERRLAAMADVQRAGRIGRNELDLDLLRVRRGLAAKSLAF